MYQTPSSTVASSRSAIEPLLSTIVYRSRAATPLSGFELQTLIAAAQSRNNRESITGLVLYDDSEFFQWLEGPADGVDRIMHSIRNDPRHTDVEILNVRSSQSRVFGDWDMQFATRNFIPAVSPIDVLDPPSEVVEDLRRSPHAAHVLLAKLVAGAVRRPRARVAARKPAAPGGLVASVLKDVFLSEIVPQLLGSAGLPASGTCSPHPQAAELAERLVASDETAGGDLIAALRRKAGALWPFCANLFEPAVRRLGDLWREDRASDLDVTIALCRIQTALRTLSAAELPRMTNLARPSVLVVPAPGELHGFVANLDIEFLRTLGWMPYCEYPIEDVALEDFLSANWCDVLDLSLSAVFTRQHRLPQLTTTIAKARRASRNPGLIVLVGGRVFLEQRQAGKAVGADIVSKTVLNIDRLILPRIEELAAARPRMRHSAPALAPRPAPRRAMAAHADLVAIR